MVILSTPNAKLDIKTLGSAELEAYLAAFGQPAYRARQIERWLYAPDTGVRSFDEMTDLPHVLRTQLSETCLLAFPEIVQRYVSGDGTRKYLLRLADGTHIECVGIPLLHTSKGSDGLKDAGGSDGAGGLDSTGSPKGVGRLTVCFSTQAGCAMGCLFCASGRNGLVRSLAPGEMVDQLLVVAQDFAQFDPTMHVTNAVAMGQGEPFANYDATLAALRFMNNPKLFGIGARRLTVSTCGILGPLRRFASEPEQFTLAVSLHSAIQATRDRLLPGLANHPLGKLRLALAEYMEKTGRRPSLEYALIDSVNDSDVELEALIAFCKGRGEYHPWDVFCRSDMLYRSNTPCHEGLEQKPYRNQTRNPSFHINLIPLNAIDSLDWKPSSASRVRDFEKALKEAGIETSVRSSRGSDIAGACGQLVGS